MTIDQVVNELIKERREGITSRFPCRAIMVKNIRDYSALLTGLNRIPDIEMVSSDELFPSADVMPQYEILKDARYQNRWLVLPGVSEYLRLFNKSEAETQRFAKLWSCQAPATSVGRIIIPLWGCEAQWHDKALHLCEDVRQDSFYYDCIDEIAEEQQLNLVVLSGEFEQYVFKLNAQKGQVNVGLREWYEYWSEPSRINDDQILLTKRYRSIQPTTGSISVRVIRDSFSFIKESLIGAHTLTEEECPREAQALLFDSALQGETLDKAILSTLNVGSFTGIDVMSKWYSMEQGKKQLAALWMKLHPDGSYLNHCIQKAPQIDDIPDHILHDIFTLYLSHSDWIAESQALVSSMGMMKDDKFFSELDNVPVYEDRLAFLSGRDKNERIYLLRLVGKWMREDSAQALASQRLGQIYPDLLAYLDGSGYDEDLRRYLSLYKSHKLENSLPADEQLYFSGIKSDVYDFRYALLSNALTDESVVLWVDALGAEWMPLIMWALQQDRNGAIKEAAVAQATLPTETCFNEQWKQMTAPYKKLDRLDKLAHKGVIDDPDYYTCVEDQIAFVTGLRSKVDELLNDYHRVIITGDHGTSRLAARFFHKRDGMPVPKDSTVCSHGRYCRLAENADVQSPDISIVKDSSGIRYAVFSNYDHFVQPGFAAGADDENAVYGEVHGGATPEEMLVPVIVFDSLKEIPLTASWLSSTVKISAKKVKATLKFSKAVDDLQVRIGSVDGVCSTAEDRRVWTVVFQGVLPKTHSVSVAANGSLVPVEELTVLPALGGGDGDLP